MAALTREAATERIQTWLTRQEPDALLISDWVVTEFASALSIKVRMELVGIRDRARVAGLFTRLRAESLTVVPVTREHFLTAARFAEQFGTGLRGRRVAWRDRSRARRHDLHAGQAPRRRRDIAGRECRPGMTHFQ